MKRFLAYGVAATALASCALQIPASPSSSSAESSVQQDGRSDHATNKAGQTPTESKKSDQPTTNSAIAAAFSDDPDVSVHALGADQSILFPFAEELKVESAKGGVSRVTVRTTQPLASIAVYRQQGLYGEFEMVPGAIIATASSEARLELAPAIYRLTFGPVAVPFDEEFRLPSLPSGAAPGIRTIQSARKVLSKEPWSTEGIATESLGSPGDRLLVINLDGHNSEHFPDGRWGAHDAALRAQIGNDFDSVRVTRDSREPDLQPAVTDAVKEIRRRNQRTLLRCHSAGCNVARLIEVLLGEKNTVIGIQMFTPINRGVDFAFIQKVAELFSRRYGGQVEFAAFLATLARYDVRSSSARSLPLKDLVSRMNETFLTDGFLARCTDGIRPKTPSRDFWFRTWGLLFVPMKLRPEYNRTTLQSNAGYRTLPGMDTIPTYADDAGNRLENYLYGLEQAERIRGLSAKRNWHVFAGYTNPSFAEKQAAEFRRRALEKDGVSALARIDWAEIEETALGYGATLIPQMAGNTRDPLPEAMLNDGIGDYAGQIMASPEGPSLLDTSSTKENLVINTGAERQRMSPRIETLFTYRGVSHRGILDDPRVVADAAAQAASLSIWPDIQILSDADRAEILSLIAARWPTRSDAPTSNCCSSVEYTTETSIVSILPSGVNTAQARIRVRRQSHEYTWNDLLETYYYSGAAPAVTTEYLNQFSYRGSRWVWDGWRQL